LEIPDTIKSFAFVFLLIGFATKGGLVPLHIWLPYAHPAAPSNVSAVMSGIMLKMSVYGVIRFVINILGADIMWWGVLVLVIGVVSTILGVMYALMEHDIKRLLAYHSIENMGIIFIGLGLAMIAGVNGANTLMALCLTAALFHTFNHSLFKSLLFMGAGSIQYATGTRDIEKLGGLIKKMPYTAFLFLIGAMAISAIPLLNGFASEWMIYQGLFASILAGEGVLRILMIITVSLLAMAGALAAYCFVKVFGISFLALPRTQLAENAKEVPNSMIFAMGVLALLCIVAGIIPSAFIWMINGITGEIIGRSVTFGVFDVYKLAKFMPLGVSSGISPVIMLAILIIITSVVVILIKTLTKGTRVRKCGTWDCGFKQNLTSGMEYTATGFSKPLRIVFRWLYKPERKLIIDEMEGKYNIKSARYVVSTKSVFEDYLYKPVINGILEISGRLRFAIQMGSIHAYLLYIFAVLIVMLVYFTRT
ncbi:MAG: proton-conducting transporter membrane subunit, partial [Eubacteriales bacterium]